MLGRSISVSVSKGWAEQANFGSGRRHGTQVELGLGCEGRLLVVRDAASEFAGLAERSQGENRGDDRTTPVRREVHRRNVNNSGAGLN